MKAALYCRVSTLDQNVETQLSALRDYCQREGITIIKEYVDEGVSGSKTSRPSFNELMDGMRVKSFDTIIVYKLDRIGRSLAHLLQLFSEFKNRDINFISITQSINTTTPEGRMFLHILMTLAEYERELTVSRVKSGLDRARKEGKTLGRPKGSKDGKQRRKSGYYLRWSKT